MEQPVVGSGRHAAVSQPERNFDENDPVMCGPFSKHWQVVPMLGSFFSMDPLLFDQCFKKMGGTGGAGSCFEVLVQLILFCLIKFWKIWFGGPVSGSLHDGSFFW